MVSKAVREGKIRRACPPQCYNAVQTMEPRVNQSLTRGEALAFQSRWRVVNARQTEELRRATIDQKLLATDTLMRSVGEMGWRAALAEEDRREHELWNELRRRLHG